MDAVTSIPCAADSLFVPDAMAAKLRGIARELRQQPARNLEDEALARRLEAYAEAIVRPELESEQRLFHARFQRLGTRRLDASTALA